MGRAILEPLRELDVVAYLRFASVYQNFDGLEDFPAGHRSIEDASGGMTPIAGSDQRITRVRIVPSIAAMASIVASSGTCDTSVTT